MTIEELLQPRFKVVANFPDNTRKIGDIIYVENTKEKYWKENFEKWLSSFPHLFKKLEWWEDRKIEDLPEYLKDHIGVFKVLKYNLNAKVVIIQEDNLFEEFIEFISVFQPATKEEYEANKNI